MNGVSEGIATDLVEVFQIPKEEIEWYETRAQEFKISVECASDGRIDYNRVVLESPLCDVIPIFSYDSQTGKLFEDMGTVNEEAQKRLIEEIDRHFEMALSPKIGDKEKKDLLKKHFDRVMWYFFVANHKNKEKEMRALFEHLKNSGYFETGEIRVSPWVLFIPGAEDLQVQGLNRWLYLRSEHGVHEDIYDGAFLEYVRSCGSDNLVGKKYAKALGVTFSDEPSGSKKVIDAWIDRYGRNEDALSAFVDALGGAEHVPGQIAGRLLEKGITISSTEESPTLRSRVVGVVFQEVLTDDFSLFSLYPTQHARDMTLAAGDILNRIVRAIETDPNIKDNADKVFEEILKNRNTLVDPFTFHHSELVRVGLSDGVASRLIELAGVEFILSASSSNLGRLTSRELESLERADFDFVPKDKEGFLGGATINLGGEAPKKELGRVFSWSSVCDGEFQKAILLCLAWGKATELTNKKGKQKPMSDLGKMNTGRVMSFVSRNPLGLFLIPAKSTHKLIRPVLVDKEWVLAAVECGVYSAHTIRDPDLTQYLKSWFEERPDIVVAWMTHRMYNPATAAVAMEYRSIIVRLFGERWAPLVDLENERGAVVAHNFETGEDDKGVRIGVMPPPVPELVANDTPYGRDGAIAHVDIGGQDSDTPREMRSTPSVSIACREVSRGIMSITFDGLSELGSPRVSIGWNGGTIDSEINGNDVTGNIGEWRLNPGVEQTLSVVTVYDGEELVYQETVAHTPQIRKPNIVNPEELQRKINDPSEEAVTLECERAPQMALILRDSEGNEMSCGQVHSDAVSVKKSTLKNELSIGEWYAFFRSSEGAESEVVELDIDFNPLFALPQFTLDEENLTSMITDRSVSNMELCIKGVSDGVMVNIERMDGEGDVVSLGERNLSKRCIHLDLDALRPVAGVGVHSEFVFSIEGYEVCRVGVDFAEVSELDLWLGGEEFTEEVWGDGVTTRIGENQIHIGGMRGCPVERLVVMYVVDGERYDFALSDSNVDIPEWLKTKLIKELEAHQGSKVRSDIEALYGAGTLSKTHRVLTDGEYMMHAHEQYFGEGNIPKYATKWPWRMHSGVTWSGFVSAPFYSCVAMVLGERISRVQATPGVDNTYLEAIEIEGFDPDHPGDSFTLKFTEDSMTIEPLCEENTTRGYLQSLHIQGILSLLCEATRTGRRTYNEEEEELASFDIHAPVSHEKLTRAQKIQKYLETHDESHLLCRDGEGRRVLVGPVSHDEMETTFDNLQALIDKVPKNEKQGFGEVQGAVILCEKGKLQPVNEQSSSAPDVTRQRPRRVFLERALISLGLVSKSMFSRDPYMKDNTNRTPWLAMREAWGSDAATGYGPFLTSEFLTPVCTECAQAGMACESDLEGFKQQIIGMMLSEEMSEKSSDWARVFQKHVQESDYFKQLIETTPASTPGAPTELDVLIGKMEETGTHFAYIPDRVITIREFVDVRTGKGVLG